MTLRELNKKLGEQIDLLTDPSTSYEAKKGQADIAQTICSLAKQVINGADVTLRTEKLVAEGKLKGSVVQELL